MCALLVGLRVCTCKSAITTTTHVRRLRTRALSRGGGGGRGVSATARRVTTARRVSVTRRVAAGLNLGFDLMYKIFHRVIQGHLLYVVSDILDALDGPVEGLRRSLHVLARLCLEVCGQHALDIPMFPIG